MLVKRFFKINQTHNEGDKNNSAESVGGFPPHEEGNNLHRIDSQGAYTDGSVVSDGLGPERDYEPLDTTPSKN